MQYYLHNFLIEQPDLNLHNPPVQDALLDVARFWLERGVDGFRLDTINFYFHDQDCATTRRSTKADRNDKTAPAVNPYNFQDHLYDKNQPENLASCALPRAAERVPGDRLGGRGGRCQRGAEIQAEYTSGGDKLHMCYDFDFLSNHPPTGTFIASVLDKANRTLVGRLGLLGLLEPRRRAPPLALEPRRRGAARLCGAAPVAARARSASTRARNWA
jgi:alpha-glucosidase